MSNGNPDINKYSVPFGPDNDPHKAQKKSAPWSIRNAVRRICAREMIKMQADEKMTIERLAELVFDGRQPSMGEMVALRRVFEALRGNPKFSQFVTEDVDGKLVQKTVEAKATLAEIVSKSYDEEQADEPEHTTEGSE